MSGLMSCGFLFTPSGREVLLVQKNRPEWQAGNWNGVGGRAEPGETVDDCMRREFREETGLTTDWQEFAVERGLGYSVHFYKSFLDGGSWTGIPPRVPDANDSGERLAWILSDLRSVDPIGNLRWLVPLARDWREMYVRPVFSFTDDIRERPTW